MVGIRVDANETIASGHVMRCLSIADAFFSYGKDVLFIVSDELGAERVNAKGYKCICLNSDWRDKDSELKELISVLDGNKIELLLIDSYQVTRNYLDSIRKVVKLAYIDDLDMFDYPVDILINYSIYANKMKYPRNKEYLLGTQYTPLRKQFDISENRIKLALKERADYKQIMITTGASDPYRIAIRFVKGILDEPILRDYKVTVVRGMYWDYKISQTSIVNDINEDKCAIELVYDDESRVTVLENVDDMADLMLKSSMAVSSGGSTLYELCACCVPTVMFSYADNQLKNVTEFEQRKIMDYAGDVRMETDLIKNTINMLIKNTDQTILKNKIQRMPGLCCGQGATKLVGKLLTYIESETV